MTNSRSFSLEAVSRQRGFTLIELLMVVAIIAVLAALLFPIVGTMQRSARSTQCAGNLRQICMAARAYSGDNNGLLMPSGSDGQYAWPMTVQSYLTGNVTTTDESKKYSKISYCPEFYLSDPKGKKTALKDRYGFTWDPGYTINDVPGLPENSKANRVNLNSKGERVNLDWTGDFRYMEITYKSVRPWIMDGAQWQTGSDGASVDYNRHGKNKSNVLFFDGHIETATKVEITTGIKKPASLPGGIGNS